MGELHGPQLRVGGDVFALDEVDETLNVVIDTALEEAGVFAGGVLVLNWSQLM